MASYSGVKAYGLLVKRKQDGAGCLDCLPSPVRGSDTVLLWLYLVLRHGLSSHLVVGRRDIALASRVPPSPHSFWVS